MTKNQKAVRAAALACFERAKKLYNLPADLELAVSFKLRGRARGKAIGRYAGTEIDPTTLEINVVRTYEVRFNAANVENSVEDMINVVVPHEVAHAICYINPKLGNDHDAGWQRVCKKLGGTGAAFHTNAVIYGTGKTYEFTTTTGFKMRLSEARFKKVMTGTVYSIGDNGAKGDLNQDCAYVIVGERGFEYPEPVVPAKKAIRPVATRTVPKGTSKASVVRDIIALIKTNYCIADGDDYRKMAMDMAVRKLGLTAGYARNAVNANWEKVNYRMYGKLA